MAGVNLVAIRGRNPKHSKLLDDCIRIQGIMEAGHGPALAYLESKLASWQGVTGSLKKALTTALQIGEASAGIKPSAPIYMRFLTAEEFIHYSQQGALFKDVGAGNLHGEYTHRIQWYAIIHEMSAAFTKEVSDAPPVGWNFTPAQLLINVNGTKLDIKPNDWPEGPEGNQGFWDALLDRGPGIHPGFDPTADGISNPEIFNLRLMDRPWLEANHTDLHQKLTLFATSNMDAYQGVYGSLAVTYPTLSRIVSQRYVKRERQRISDKEVKQQYVKKKLEQKAPKTLYKASPVSVDGVIETRVAEEQKKGHCFLTTACVEARGLPDDCEELQVLRAFRDTYVRERPGGPALIDHYYAVAPGIVESVRSQPGLWEHVYRTIRETVARIRRAEHESALALYARMVNELECRCLDDSPFAAISGRPRHRGRSGA